MVWQGDPHRPVQFWISSKPSRGRAAIIMLAVLAAMGAYFLLWALIAGLGAFSGDWSGPLIINGRGFTWEFEKAWHFFVPVCAVLPLSVIGMFGSLIHIVTHPRDGRSTSSSRDE